mgnify:FL=1
MSEILLVGTYSDIGIHKLEFGNGFMTLIQQENSFENCSFICNNKDLIFSTVEYSNNPSYSNGLLVLRDSKLSILNSYEICGNSPCYSYFDDSRNLLYIANYMDVSLNVYSINSENKSCKFLFKKAFTDHSHMHCIVLSKDKSTLFVTDLGDNKLYAFDIFYKDDTLDLKLISCYPFDVNSGPRHFVTDENNIYLITENSCELYHLVFDRSSGFKLINRCSILPDNTKHSDDTGCSIKFGLNKTFLYTSVRGRNIINVFSLDLVSMQTISCYGKTPRDLFVLDDDLLCANQNSDSIAIFDIEKNTGKLNYKNSYSISSPACIIKL